MRKKYFFECVCVCFCMSVCVCVYFVWGTLGYLAGLRDHSWWGLENFISGPNSNIGGRPLTPSGGFGVGTSIPITLLLAAL